MKLSTSSSSSSLRPRKLAHPPSPWKFWLLWVLETTLQVPKGQSHRWMRMERLSDSEFGAFCFGMWGQISSRPISKNVGLGSESWPHHLLAG